MEEDIRIIDNKTRNEKIKNFLIKNKKIFITIFSVLIFLVIGIYSFQIFKEAQKKKISDKYNNAIIEYKSSNKIEIIKSLKEVVNDKDSTYSPLALYFIIDNNLINDNNEINDLFDVLINQVSLEKEIKNLIIYKKALFNADSVNEIELLKILSPIINSKSIWKSHSLYLVGEFFLNKEEIEKSKEFFNEIAVMDNPNSEILIRAQRRLNRDLSD